MIIEKNILSYHIKNSRTEKTHTEIHIIKNTYWKTHAEKNMLKHMLIKNTHTETTNLNTEPHTKS